MMKVLSAWPYNQAWPSCSGLIRERKLKVLKIKRYSAVWVCSDIRVVYLITSELSICLVSLSVCYRVFHLLFQPGSIGEPENAWILLKPWLLDFGWSPSLWTCTLEHSLRWANDSPVIIIKTVFSCLNFRDYFAHDDRGTWVVRSMTRIHTLDTAHIGLLCAIQTTCSECSRSIKHNKTRYILHFHPVNIRWRSRLPARGVHNGWGRWLAKARSMGDYEWPCCSVALWVWAWKCHS